ncbi:GntR family transcriptional regulator [Nonomuraea sp. NPDC005650]|uniref:FadR/GntR family transcriptional regulator n=1 Tax=Nonomuraea sp. NPDC005650 TaxID=3157045 RepID=UPI0033A857F9
MTGLDRAGALSAAFAPLSDVGRADAVIHRIGEAVTLGLLVDGDQLPSENDLADQLGVANGTVREALAVLRQRGLVETRRGRAGGSFIRANEDALAALHLDRVKNISIAALRDLGDESAAVFMATAKLAAERAPVDTAVRLKADLADLRSAATPAAARRAEARFHIDVATASQSVRLTHATVRLQAELGPMVWLAGNHPDPDVVADRLEDLVVAVAAGDSESARSVAEVHSAAAIRAAIGTHLALTDDHYDQRTARRPRP